MWSYIPEQNRNIGFYCIGKWFSYTSFICKIWKMFESQNVSLIDSSLHKAICYMVIDEVVVVDEVLK